MTKKELEQEIRYLEEQIEKCNNVIRDNLGLYYGRPKLDGERGDFFPNKTIKQLAWQLASSANKMKNELTARLERLKETLSILESKEDSSAGEKQ